MSDIGDDRDAMPRWVRRAMVLFFAGVAAADASRWVLVHVRTLVVLVLVSLFLSFAIEPPVNRLAARGWRRGPATALVFAITLVLAGGFAYLIGAVVAGQVNQFVDRAPGYVDSVIRFVNDTFHTHLTSAELRRQLSAANSPVRRTTTSLAHRALTLSVTVLGLVVQALVVALLTFYLVADGPRLRRTVCGWLPARHQRAVLRAWELAIAKTGGYVSTRSLLAVISGVAHAIFLELIGVPFAVALALWIGVMSQFVPVVGTYLAGTLPVLIALGNRPSTALWLVIFIVVFQQLENHVLLPRLTAHTLEIHPAVAFGAVIGGAGLLGPVGAVIALPIAAAFQAFISDYLPQHEVVPSRITAEAPRRARRWRTRSRGGPSPGDGPPTSASG